MFRSWMEDLRYGARVLWRMPGLTAVAALTLALGIATSTTVFAWIDGLVLHPFRGARDDGQLAVLETVRASGTDDYNVSYSDFRDYQDSLRLVDGLALRQTAPASVGEGETAQAAWFELVSGNYFDVMGVKPVLGRSFARDEFSDKAKTYAAVISYRLWRNLYLGDPQVLGRTVRINRQQVTIVGVAPEEFHGDTPGLAFDGWVPMVLAGEMDRDARHFGVIARLKKGVGVAQASAEAAGVASQLEKAYPKTNQGISARVVPIWKAQSGASSLLLAPLGILAAACGVVLLIACFNVANLLLARSTARQTEFTIRAALGASSGRIARQMLAESLLLAGLATVISVCLVPWMANALVYLLPPTGMPILFDVELSARVFGFAVLLCLAAALAAGLPPMLHSLRPSLTGSLKQSSRNGTESAGSRRVGGLLVVSEVSLALVALATLGLFAQSLRTLQSTPGGFDATNVMVSRLFLVTNNYTGDEERQFCRRLRDRLLPSPGIAGAAYADSIPLGFGLGKWSDITVDGYTPRQGEGLAVHHAAVSPDYFEVMRMPLVSGRDLKSTDDAKSTRVMIVNESFARRFFNGRDPVGRRVQLSKTPFTIVGMVKDSKYYSLSEAPQPYFYMAFDQVHNGSGDSGVAVFVRTAGDPRGLVPMLRREMAAIDPKSGGFETMPLADYIGAAWFGPRLAAVVLGVLGCISLLLAAVGLYSVMAYGVSQRTREIGVRMALGAKPWTVLGMVMRRGVLLAAAGIAAGLAGTLALTRLIAHMLFRVSPTDPLTIGLAASFLGAVALLASFLPAWRATKVDPIVALRQE